MPDLCDWPAGDLADRVEILECVVAQQSDLIKRQMIQLAEMQIRDRRRAQSDAAAKGCSHGRA